MSCQHHRAPTPHQTHQLVDGEQRVGLRWAKVLERFLPHLRLPDSEANQI